MATLVGSIIVFMLVVLLHELGHFTVAKAVGIKVNEFSIGMGPKLFQKTKGETKYSLRILPIGGYVAMEGEEEESKDPRSFGNANVYSRMAVVVAGAFMNLVLAVLAFFLVAILVGKPLNTNKIGNVIPNSPAYESGIMKNDRILDINGKKIEDFKSIIATVNSSEDKLMITIDRNGEIISKEVSAINENGKKYIGINPETEISISYAISNGFIRTFEVISDVFNTLQQLLTKNVGVDMLAGPVGVISFIGQATSMGIVYLLHILGLISANLAVINMLPIPALDGGKFLFLIIEAIRKKKISEKLETNLSLISLTLLLALMFYVTIFGDLARINPFGLFN